MNAIFVFSCLFAAAAAKPGLLSYAPAIQTHQYHAQDAFGQYSYGYSGGPSAKEETRTADGITRGSYSYVDAHGIVQSASYVSDPIHGFRVAATNLPTGPAAPAPAVIAPAAVAVHPAPAVIAAAPAVVAAAPAETPEVIAAKAAHFAAHHEALARLGRRKRGILSGLHAPVAYSAPAATVVSHAGPAIVAARTAAVVAAPAVVEHPKTLAYSTPGATVVSSSAPISGSFSYSSSSVAAAPVAHVAAAPVAHVAAAPAVVAARAAPIVAAAPAIVEHPKTVAYSTPGSTVVSSSAPISGSFSYSSSSVAAAPVAHVAAAPAVVAAAPVAHVAAAPAVVAARTAAAPAIVAAAPAIVETPSSVAYSTGDSTVVSSAAPVSGSFSYSSSSVAASPVPAETAHVVAAAPAVVAARVAAPAVAAHVAAAPAVVAAAPAVTAHVAAAPAVVAARAIAPAVVAAPAVAASSSQFHAQDAIGQYNYGYADHLSSKHETRSADGTTFGKYSYLDSNGIVQSVKYVADDAGFRVHATNLPHA